MKQAPIKTLLLLAFFLSGCGGLIYQTVWVRMLGRYLGATTHATATVLVVFMLGLALGSLIGGRFADRARSLLLIYGLLELAIAAAGLLASFLVIRGLGRFYVEAYGVVGHQPGTLLALQVGFVVLCLLLPTVLMGITLPVLAGYVVRLGAQFEAGLGWLYALNTYGAVAGVLVTGLVLLGEWGESVSLATAGVMNALAALLALGVWRSQPVAVAAEEEETTAVEPIVPYSPGIRRLALLTFFFSGLSALAYEILWSRLLVLFLQTSIYAYSIMLALFLVGIALGSAEAARRPGLWRAPLAGFALLELLIGCWGVVGLLLLQVFGRVALAVTGQESVMEPPWALGVLATAVVVLPTAYFFGMQFPVAVRCCIADANTPGKSTGRAYAVNTLGTIVGSLGAGFFLIPILGTAGTFLLLAAGNMLLGLALFMAARQEAGARPRTAAVLSVIFVAALLLVGDPYERIMAARVQAAFGGEGQVYSYFERTTATTMAAGDPTQPRSRALLVNGVGMTHLCSETKLMAHLPLLLAERPQRLLVICFGMGTTFRSACRHPGLQVDAVDIIPEVFDCFGFFHADAARYGDRPQTRRFADDGRNFLLVRPELYDVITVDPAPPVHSAGTVNLYAREFFELCKVRLTPGGVFCLWLPPAAESEALMILRSFFAVFPEGALWGGHEFQGFYLVGGHRPMRQTPEQVAALAEQLSRIEDLGEWDMAFRSPEVLKSLYITDAAGLKPLLANVPDVTDDRPYTEFPLWRQLWHPAGQRLFTADVLRQRLGL